MKQKSFLLPLLLVLSIICSCFSKDESNPCVPTTSDSSTPISTFENGKLYLASGYECDHLKILVLKGTWQEMGRQYGYLLKTQMDNFYRTALQNSKLSYNTMKNRSEEIFNGSYTYIQEFITGMAETSGFSLEKQKIICYLIRLIGGELLGLFGCSSMAAWGDFTGGNSIVIGRNYDFTTFNSFQKFVTIVVYNPTGSPNIVADVNFIGAICFGLTSLNSNGIYIDHHAGYLSDPTYIQGRSTPFNAILLDTIFNCTSISGVETRLLDHANLPYMGIILNVADINECRVYELATYDAKKRTGNGFMVSSNHFVAPGWSGLPKIPSGAQGTYSLERQANLQVLGNRYKGSIDAERMMKIFDITFSGGGATTGSTIFQVVTLPNEKIMWVKAPGLRNWVKVDLNPFF